MHGHNLDSHHWQLSDQLPLPKRRDQAQAGNLGKHGA